MNLNGEFWFSRRYAAELLGTTRAKIDTMVIRGLLHTNPLIDPDWIAESDVNWLRQNPDVWLTVKKLAKEPRAAKPKFANTPHSKHPDQEVLPISDHRHVQVGKRSKD